MPKHFNPRTTVVLDHKLIKRVPKFCRRERKISYVDEIAAQLAIENIQLNARRTIHDENRCYSCRYCRGYHLTSQELRGVDPGIAHSA